MNKISVNLNVNEKLFLRDPQATELGKKIIKQSIQLIHEIGLERLTFKKLAAKIPSTEASIYRYFENKHLLFIYLLNWYWEWVSFRIDLHTMNISDPKEQLHTILRVIVDAANRNTQTDFVDEDILHEIVVREGTKAYHSISVDDENKDGFFLAYKLLCKKIGTVITLINPTYPYPRALATMLIETANNHLYFAKHLPRLTDIRGEGQQLSENVREMLEFVALGLCANNQYPKSNKNGQHHYMPINNNESMNGQKSNNR